jgi:hypothetical protein
MQSMIQLKRQLQINISNDEPYSAQEHDQRFYEEVESTFLSNQDCFLVVEINLKYSTFVHTENKHSQDRQYHIS